MSRELHPSHRAPVDDDAQVGGQAVLEGVMMRGASTWAVAVRAPSPAGEAAPGPISVSSFPLVSRARGARILRRPLVRGVVALCETIGLGMKALAIAAQAQRDDDEEISRGAWAMTVALALAFAVGLFFVVPVALTSLAKDRLGSPVAFWLVEGAVRTSIFLAYLAVISRQRDLRRVFEYHGAEHKAIACQEAGVALEPAHAERFSRLHPRCGTSFLLVVMLVAIVVFAPLGLPAWYVLVASRVLGVPLIAGVAYEVVRWAGRHRARPAVRALMWPGLQLQKLTTREPDRAQLAVAIAALEAVLAVEGAVRPRVAARPGVTAVAHDAPGT